MADTAQKNRLIMSHEFAKALCDAGIIDFDLSAVNRIVIDAKAGSIVVMYVEQVADSRWLDVALTLDGVEIRTSPEEADG